jgi:hypothetical protein
MIALICFFILSYLLPTFNNVFVALAAHLVLRLRAPRRPQRPITRPRRPRQLPHPHRPHNPPPVRTTTGAEHAAHVFATMVNHPV